MRCPMKTVTWAACSEGQQTSQAEKPTPQRDEPGTCREDRSAADRHAEQDCESGDEALTGFV